MAFKKKEILSLVTKWLELEGIILNEISHNKKYNKPGTEGQVGHDFTHVLNLKRLLVHRLGEENSGRKRLGPKRDQGSLEVDCLGNVIARWKEQLLIFYCRNGNRQQHYLCILLNTKTIGT